MNIATIKKIRDALRGKCVLTITCDNNYQFSDGNSDTVVLWCDADEHLVCIRPTPTSDQSRKPYEVTVVEYECIQFIEAYTDKNELKDFMDNITHENKQNAYDYITQSDVSHSNTTGSTGDGIDWGINTKNIRK